MNRTFSLAIVREDFAVYFPPIGPSVPISRRYAIEDLVKTMSYLYPNAKTTVRVKVTKGLEDCWTEYIWEVEA